MTLLSAADIAGMHDTLTELSNAVLLSITGPGSPDAYGDAAEDGTELWSGEAPGFLEDLDHEEEVAGRQELVQRTTFLIFDEAGASVVELAGPSWTATTVVIEDRRLATAVERRFSVLGMEHQADNTLDSVLLTLGSESTPPEEA